MKKIYPCLTTLTKGNWEKQIADIDKYHLTEVAVFLTGLNFWERRKLYNRLKQSKVKYVPHIHLREGMTNEEIDFFYQHYKTRQFNTHGNYLKFFKSHPYFEKYFLLETTTYFTLRHLQKVRGHYCLDLAHLFSRRTILTKWRDLKYIPQLIKQEQSPQANHLSGLTINCQDTHLIKKLNYYNYLKKTPKTYLAKIICLEVENPIKDQLKFIKYIQELI